MFLISNKMQETARTPHARCDFVSFDGGAQGQGVLQQPDRYRYWSGHDMQSSRISRGAGLSYAAGSFRDGGLSVSHASFDRVTGFDEKRAVVEVEAGITLASLYSFLSQRGLYLLVQPGHGRITVGGCIAADVHGKNQAQDGTFIDQVESLVLFHPVHGLMEISREHEPDVFRLTCGGYGLTGHIISARLFAKPIPSNAIHLKATKFDDSRAGLANLKEAAAQADFAYSWHDMASKGEDLGAGYVFRANFVPSNHLDASSAIDVGTPKLSAAMRGVWRVSLLNALTARGLNGVYRYQQRAALRGKNISLQDALYPIHRAQTYYRLFGTRGFHEYQVILPLNAMEAYLEAVKTRVLTLASAKAFAGTRELLRFTGDGICLALNFPRNQSSLESMAFLDERVIALGGVPNIIKDSRLPRTVVDACFPGADHFRAALRAFDPKRMFRSELSERLAL
jgi:decaprenylphospho-beta-D-ribofuranose 2-oxidase